MKNKIVEALLNAGLYSAAYRDRVANEALILIGNRELDEGRFDSWLSGLNFEGQNIRSYFLSCLKNALEQELFNPSSASPSPGTLTCQTVEEFEASWEEHKRLLMDLNDDMNSDSDPHRGVLSHDNNTNEVRAVSDGKGGLIYIDGTISGKYPRLEDIPEKEQRELYELVKQKHGTLIYLEEALRRMREHGKACNN